MAFAMLIVALFLLLDASFWQFVFLVWYLRYTMRGTKTKLPQNK